MIMQQELLLLLQYTCSGRLDNLGVTRYTASRVMERVSELVFRARVMERVSESVLRARVMERVSELVLRARVMERNQGGIIETRREKIG